MNNFPTYSCSISIKNGINRIRFRKRKFDHYLGLNYILEKVFLLHDDNFYIRNEGYINNNFVIILIIIY